MSHIVTIKTKLADASALTAACRRLGLAPPEQGTAQLFADKASGWIVKLPGWTYPAVVDTHSGEVRYDNFRGHWGKRAELDRLLQCYAVEKTRIEARRMGHTLTEQPLPDGTIKLTIQLGGDSGGQIGGAL